MPTEWTDDLIETLTVLWSEGLTAETIAKKMGLPSRSSVIGKVGRLGLQRRGAKASQTPRPTVKPKPRKREADRRAEIVLALEAPEIVDPVTPFEPGLGRGTDAVLTLHPNQCRYPTGDPLKDPAGFYFCTRQRAEGKPYCAGHSLLCSTPSRPPERRNTHGPINFVRMA
jgi:hypothetical protein